MIVDQKFKEHIINMLTLRYDPMDEPGVPHLKPKAWIPTIYDSTATRLEKRLDIALNRIADAKRIGIALSSGIDSVLLLCLIREKYPDKEIICFHHVGINPEAEDALAYAQEYDAKFVQIKLDSILQTLDWQRTMFKDMIWDGFDYVLSQTAKKMKCDVLIDGSGADELFAGYIFRYFAFIPKNNTLAGQIEAYLHCHKRDWVEDQANMFGPEIKFNWDMIHAHLKPYFDNTLPPISQVYCADFNGKLAHLFSKKQRVFSKVYDIPYYSPYLHPEVVRYGTHLETDCKIMLQQGKIPLRQIAARHNLVVTPKKYGYSMDTVGEWNGPDWETAHNDITDPNNQIFTKGLISYDWVKRHTLDKKSRYDVRYVNKFFQLMALENHLRHLEFD